MDINGSLNKNNFIPEIEWVQSEMVNRECLYGYSHHLQGYLPFKEVTEVKGLRKKKTGEWVNRGVKGIAENGDKLYIMLIENLYQKCVEKGWLEKE